MGRVGYAAKLMLEFWRFARAHKAYWIIPLLFVLALVIALVVVGQSSAPFIYTLF